MPAQKNENILWFKQVGKNDLGLVGGKNSALGEMYSKLTKTGINVPNGFCVTAKAYQEFLKYAGLKTKIASLLKDLDTNNSQELAQRGKDIRSLILEAEFSDQLKADIVKNYKKLSVLCGVTDVDVAVRSSATAEDLPMASFAGQLESYLNISGSEKLLMTVKMCIASLYTDRAISYRQDQKFSHSKVSLSVGVQQMVRSDMAGAGVMFTLDTESGFRDLILINASWGLGENIVKGRVDPDEYYVYKPTFNGKFKPLLKKQVGRKQLRLVYSKKTSQSVKNLITSSEERKKLVLSDKEILQLAEWGMTIEKYFKRPMDIEWAKDGKSRKLFIVQARPETVYSTKDKSIFEDYQLIKHGKELVSGTSVGNKIGAGPVRIIKNPTGLAAFKPGEVLVARMTDPAWEPMMKKASAIITDSGGRTCHAAIVSRELGVPCIVGTKNGTKKISNRSQVTVDCSSGIQGFVYSGLAEFTKQKVNLKKIKKPTGVKIMMNVGNPHTAFAYSSLPNDGIGLAREEFIITDYIRIHPLALINYYGLPLELKKKIEALTSNYSNKKDFFVDKLAEGIGQLAASVYPKEIIVRFSDFKTNEYKKLIGGSLFEPQEENPMLGWRGASRYYDPKVKQAFVLECRAVRKVINQFGLDNVSVMIPFVRTVDEAKKVLAIMRANNLKRTRRQKVYLMCELPANIILAKDFLNLVDGFSIGSNDLTQLILGVDRDSDTISALYDERNPAVLASIAEVINVAKKMNKKIGICGQAPSDFPDFARYLLKHRIDSMSLTPDSIIKTIKALKK
ncbi:phosphoenolpyruvate synthase [Candidatus Falkowbacteria bacterium CG10_big_fil_rev_8_21_14_0_10_39_11]|uniref:Phosphoenolpyruvate synthase n=1 Tax=Candidatus Falkowbacteria bacterium CG10_big_fil_rev_8_21_14_0_10_39_11 TaxID=1974565 RepID=A0A2H0V6C1_9BACT|nr:MAG: phosphoenolpyruvate synthase [Candidatus Falkowbacteria bacterium CG10_big_fil_rev_8_21_14_0_10_39_11]